MELTTALLIVLIIILIGYMSGFIMPIEGMKRSFQSAAGFLPEYLRFLPKGYLDGDTESRKDKEGADAESVSGPLGVKYVSNETEEGKLVSDPSDWDDAIQDIGLEPSVVESHKRYVTDEFRYINHGAAAPNLPIREADQTINPWRGLTGPIYCRGMVKDGARTVPSEDYDQLRKGTQLRWRTGWEC